jgi:16S rRNA (cytidine1402-2'-O)-methyltransferase
VALADELSDFGVDYCPDADLALVEALTRLAPGEAASEVAKALGLNRRDLYRRAMELRSEAG